MMAPDNDSAAVDAVIPRDAESAGLDGDFDEIAVTKAIEIVCIHREPLNALAVAPGVHQQTTAAANDALHVEAAFDNGRIVGHVICRIQPPIDEKSGRQNPRQWNESGVDALQHLDFLAITRATLQYYGEE